MPTCQCTRFRDRSPRVHQAMHPLTNDHPCAQLPVHQLICRCARRPRNKHEHFCKVARPRQKPNEYFCISQRGRQKKCDLFCMSNIGLHCTVKHTFAVKPLKSVRKVCEKCTVACVTKELFKKSVTSFAIAKVLVRKSVSTFASLPVWAQMQTGTLAHMPRTQPRSH